MLDIAELLATTHKRKASDLHLSSGQPPILRINGDIEPTDWPALTAAQVKDMLYSIMTESQRSEFEREYELDFAISFGEGMRFRVNAFNGVNGPASAMRAIPHRILSLEELGTPAVLKKLAELPSGMILVTGPTGSGKSTTLAAIVNHINTHFAKHILTVEDPVEFLHPSKKSLVSQREVGRHTRSFTRALKSSLREDPDVILVGELRDLETIQLALTAAETGHLVLGTLHTNSASETIDRMVDVFPAESKEMVRTMLATTLHAVVAQTLLKRVQGGRVAAYEIMLGTPAVRNLIREGKVPQLRSMIQVGSKLGMCTMKDYVLSLHKKGIITDETVHSALSHVAQEDKPDTSAGAWREVDIPDAISAARAEDPPPAAAPPPPSPQPNVF